MTIHIERVGSEAIITIDDGSPLKKQIKHAGSDFDTQRQSLQGLGCTKIEIDNAFERLKTEKRVRVNSEKQASAGQ